MDDPSAEPPLKKLIYSSNNKMEFLGDRSKMYQPYYQESRIPQRTGLTKSLPARQFRFYEQPYLTKLKELKTKKPKDIEFIIPSFTKIDDFLYDYFVNNVFGKRGRIIIKDGRKNKKEFTIKEGKTKSQAYHDFRTQFFEGDSQGDLLVDPNMKIIFRPFKPVKAKKIKQSYREGTAHCVFTPLIHTWSQKPSKYQETMLKKVTKQANLWGDKPVPHDEMETLAKLLKTTIKINDPIGNPFIIFNPGGDRTCVVSNTRKNHVDETVDDKPIFPITYRDAINKIYSLKDGEVVEGSFTDPIRIHSFTEIHEIVNPMKEYIDEITNLIPNISFDASTYPEINEFILESRIINSGTLRFQEQYDEHYDLEKAYTQFHLTKYYRNFLGIIHQWRTFTFPPTINFLKEHVGIYKATIVSPSPLAKMLGFEKNKSYILPSPEWEFHRDTKTEFTITQGLYGSTFDFRFPHSSTKEVSLRNEKLNKPFRIFAGQCSAKINEHDKKTYAVKSTPEFATHLRTLYKDVDYDEEYGCARINIEHKKVYTRHHMLSFITSYTRIVMMEEMLKFDIKNLSGITLDGLYFKGKAPKNLIPQFRPKPAIMSSNSSVNWYMPTTNIYNFPPFSPNFNINTFLEGAGGSGKTDRILKDKGFNSVIYASPTHDLGKTKVDEYSLKRYTTIHRLVGIDPNNKKIESYRDLYGEPAVLFIDELTQIESSFIDKIIDLYPHSLLLIAGDVDKDGRHYQCKYSNQIWKPTFPIVQFLQDYRAKTDQLKSLKVELRNYMRTDPTPQEIKQFVKSNYKTISKEQAKAQFTETDVWIAGTHKYIKSLEPIIAHTTHSYQGKTIKSPAKLFISIDDMFESTMFYTAMSRIESHNQLVIVC
jgi:hypothetical protein